jgi:hypothetical protein
MLIFSTIRRNQTIYFCIHFSYRGWMWIGDCWFGYFLLIFWHRDTWFALGNYESALCNFLTYFFPWTEHIWFSCYYSFVATVFSQNSLTHLELLFRPNIAVFTISSMQDGPLPHNDRVRYRDPDLYPAPLHRG